VAYYIFNTAKDAALRQMRQRLWAVDAGERHRAALAAGDLVLVYLGAPESVFIGRARLASVVDAHGNVTLAEVEEWDPPVPMRDVLAQIGPSETAKAEFDHAVVLISASEYEAAISAASA